MRDRRGCPRRRRPSQQGIHARAGGHDKPALLGRTGTWTVATLDALPPVGYGAGPEDACARPTKRNQGRVTPRNLVDRSLVPDDLGQLQVDQVRQAIDSVESGAAENRVAEVPHGHGHLSPLRVPNLVDLQLYQTPGVAHMPIVASIVHGINLGRYDLAEVLSSASLYTSRIDLVMTLCNSRLEVVEDVHRH